MRARVVEKINEVRQLVKRARGEGKRVGFIPTMGYFHAGHLSLMHKAREECDLVVVSIFVNPTQFEPGEDFKRYPRDLKRDEELAKEIGVDILFVPPEEEMYPQGYSTFVGEERLAKVLCGRSRPGHFRGVTTVVLKLLNIVSPHITYFGQKDAQQAVVVKKMVADLNLDAEIETLPTVREADGLAMSSRNAYLSTEERKAARVLSYSLREVEEMIVSGERDCKEIVVKMREIIEAEKLAKIDYIEIVNRDNLEKLEKVIAGKTLIALAVRIGPARLIDNLVV